MGTVEREPGSGDRVPSGVDDAPRAPSQHVGFRAEDHFLVAAQGIHDLQFGARDAPMFDSFDDPWTKTAVFTVYQRNTEGYFNTWRGVDGSTG